MARAERAEDRKNQTEIAEIVLRANAARYDGYIWLSEMLYRVDGCMFKRDSSGYAVPKLWFEAKQRHFVFGSFADYRISVGKLIAAKWLKETTGLPVALFARFSDGIVAGADLGKHEDGFLIAGRPPRDGFPHDIEPMARFEWGKFKIIHDPKRQAG